VAHLIVCDRVRREARGHVVEIVHVHGLHEAKDGRRQVQFLFHHAPRDAIAGEVDVPVELERLCHPERCGGAVDGDGEDRMPVALLGVKRMHADVRAEIEAVGPASDFIAAVLLPHVDEDGVVRIGSKQGGAVAAGGRLKECFDRLGKSGERHGITSLLSVMQIYQSNKIKLDIQFE